MRGSGFSRLSETVSTACMNLFELAFADHDDVVSPLVQGAGKEGFFELQEVQHPFLDGRARYEIDDPNHTLLPDAMNPPDALLQNGGVPRDVHVDHHGAALEVEAHSSGIGREKDHAVRVFPKARHQVFAVLEGTEPLRCA